MCVRISLMNLGFWGKLPKPIMALAPMADVTDAAFRRIIARYSKWGGRDIGNGSKENLPDEAFRAGGPDVSFTEFVSADGLCHKEGREKLLIDLSYSEAERPIVAQLFTAKPEKMFEAAKLVRELGFDGLDINMGCPDRAVEKQGCGAALMKNPKLARELIRAAKEGVHLGGRVGQADRERGLPVSVKTRIGYDKNELQSWLPELLAEGPAAITIHARTRKEMSDVPARWECVREAVAIRDRLRSRTLILGNGDILDVPDAKRKTELVRADGAMLGRAIFGNPLLFLHSQECKNNNGCLELFSNSRACPPTCLPCWHRQKPRRRRELDNRQAEEKVFFKLRVLTEHARLFEELLGKRKNFAVMKKHFKAYVSGWDGAKELRAKLMETKNASEAERFIKEFLNLRTF